MSESNKSYRIRTNVGSANNGPINVDVNLLQDYNIFEILSLKIDTEDLYHLHTSKYGCLVGRVVANGGVGIPNAKVSVFIAVDNIDLTDPIFAYIYPYTNTKTKNKDSIRYNLLTDQKIDECHQNIGTFPNKRLVLDDDNYIEVFDKYYKFTTTTNGSGDYMLFGLPVGNNIIHTDLDLSDIGILSQKPRDLFYKGYSATQFENASQFKKDTNLDNLTQVFSQDSSIYVFPFWGDESENSDQIKITRSDVDINYKFEPTCIFIGSIVSDEKSNAISKNCIPSERMGKMDRLTTGRGTIEMIRKTLAGNVESIAIQGNELIDGNGTWCYQIPMNLDYMKTDEYGNLVPTNDTKNGIPTRTRVRFRVSLADYESDYENTHLVKVLVPNNPTVTDITETKDNKTVVTDRTINYDYEFGSSTTDESYRDLFWNNVYTVKQYVPRIQKGNRQRNKNFTGFKAVNVNGANNPIPYNNMRINLTFLFVFQCLIFKSLVLIVKFLNKLVYIFDLFTSLSSAGRTVTGTPLVYVTLDGGMCPNLEGNYIAPGAKEPKNKYSPLIENTYHNIIGDDGLNLSGNTNVSTSASGDAINDAAKASGTTTAYDPKSSDSKNGNYNENGVLTTTFENDEGETENIKIYKNEDYFVKCVELQFAMEYEVIQFDFYNDWINGMLYIPRWFAEGRKNKDGMVYCGERFNFSRNLVQQCALGYSIDNGNLNVTTDFGCNSKQSNSKQRCHKRNGRKYMKIFGRNHGIVERLKTSKGHYVYYLRPSEITNPNGNIKYKKKANLFATDLVLLGSVNECNQYGIPKVIGYTSSSYIMPPPTGEIVYDTQEMQTNVTTGAFVVGKGSLLGIKSIITIRFKNNRQFQFKEGDVIRVKTGDSGETYGDFTVLKFTVNNNNNNTFNIRCNKITDNVYVPSIEIGQIGERPGKKVNSNDIILVNRPIDYNTLYVFNKISLSGVTTDNDTGGKESEPTYSELAGIDWGYDPYEAGTDDNTTEARKQITGHFLEIGCTYSLSNIKSCINLSRICEIGSEMSQSHYYEGSTTFVRPAGLIGKREINNDGIRTTFATLNSNALVTGIDTSTGYLRYNFRGYVPNAFMGEIPSNDNHFGPLWTEEDIRFVDGNSKSYKAFRFGTTDLNSIGDKFLFTEKNNYYMPQFENSFYFYFGLKDGSTAIDRLYTEYYAECAKDTRDSIEEPYLELYPERLTWVGGIGGRNLNLTPIKSAKITYKVEGLGIVNSTMFNVYHLENNNWVTYSNYSIDTSKSSITVYDKGNYRVTITNKSGLRASAETEVLNGGNIAQNSTYEHMVK